MLRKEAARWLLRAVKISNQERSWQTLLTVLDPGNGLIFWVIRQPVDGGIGDVFTLASQLRTAEVQVVDRRSSGTFKL